jgi:hypothetical protein
MRDTKSAAAPVSQRNEVQQCGNCLFYYYDDETNLSKYMRFSRFVDHVINDMTKDCAYWTSSDEG